MEKILVWDIPTRVGHWLLVATFAVSYLSGDSEQWRLVHVAAGTAMAAVLAFRVFWGMAGTRYARFSSFLFPPGQVFAYLASLLRGKPIHWVGHNPAGSYSIFVLLSLGLVVAGTGLAVYFEVGGDALERAHDVLSYAMLYIVGVHIAGVVVSSRMHRENLVLSMINGYKQGSRAEAIESNKKYWVLLLLGLAATASLLVLKS